MAKYISSSKIPVNYNQAYDVLLSTHGEDKKHFNLVLKALAPVIISTGNNLATLC